MELKTTFYKDFSNAEYYSISNIEKVFSRIFEKSKNNYKLLTELVFVLCCKINECYQKYNYDYADYYMKLFSIADNYAINNLKDDELDYFLEWTE